MTQLDDHLARVERYGFNRRQFPLEYNGHHLEILSNDAYELNDNRVLFDFTLYCGDCDTARNISGRFPTGFEDQMAGVVNAKIAAFDKFKYQECE